MKCRNCAKVATLHITEIVKGVVQEHHLCEECARPFLEKTSAGEATTAEATDPEESAATESVPHVVCPSCQLTFKEFRSQGRLGSAHCYEAFAAQLAPLIESVHGDTQHVGKTPKQAAEGNQRQFDLIKLRNELRRAVTEESYEEAARLRDQIQSIEETLARRNP